MTTKEIGGYLSFESRSRQTGYRGGIALNTARNAIEYFLRVKNAKRLLLPRWSCDSLLSPANRLGIPVEWYSIGKDLLPLDVPARRGDALVLVNYYALIRNDSIKAFADRYENLILDNSQAFFASMPVEIPTVFSCRKFFGVPDGAYLTGSDIGHLDLDIDLSYERFAYLFKRIDLGGTQGYSSFSKNEDLLDTLPLMKMSLSTASVMQSIDLEYVRASRENNWQVLHEAFADKNRLEITGTPSGPMCYPFHVVDGERLRALLIENKIYVPTYWKDAKKRLSGDALELDFVDNILPLPLDQRYNQNDMQRIIDVIDAAG